MNNDDNPCWGCTERTENCHKTCRKGKIAAIKRELQRRKALKYWWEHTYHVLPAEKKRAIENLKWKSGKKSRRK